MRYNDWLSYHARVSPEAPALILLPENRSFTYLDLSRRVDRTARWLAAQGVGPGDRVAIVAPNDLAHWELYWATFLISRSTMAGSPLAVIPHRRSY